MDKTEDLFRRLEQLNEIGVALSRERDINPLLERILVAAKDITRADGGTLYRVVGEGSALRFEIIRTDSLGIAMGGTTGRTIIFPDIPLRDPDGSSNERNVVAYAVNRARVRFFGYAPIRRRYRVPLPLLSHGADEEPRGRDHRGAAIDQRHRCGRYGRVLFSG